VDEQTILAIKEEDEVQFIREIQKEPVEKKYHP
jgi:hypothetical protein